MSRVISIIAGFATLLALCSASAQVPPSARLQLDGWSLSGSSVGDAASPRKATKLDRHLTLSIEGRRYDIQLVPAQRVLAGLSVSQRLTSASTRLYRGTLDGMPGTWARVTVAGDRLYALLWDGRDFIAVEPDADQAVTAPGAAKAAGATRLHAYRPAAYEGLSFLGDARAAGDGSPAKAAASPAAVKAGASAFAKADVHARLQVAWLADSAFRERHGINTEAEMLARINVASGIFEEELGLELELVELTAFADAQDPFSTSEAPRLLDEVEAQKLTTAARRDAAILHLLTGRGLEGNTVGIATVGAACSERFGVSLTESRRAAAVDGLIAAHEIGHNLNAPHDGEGACASAPAGFLMAPRLSQSDEFSSCSIDVMVDYLARASCVLDIAPSDVAIRADAPGDVLLGVATAVEYLIDSPGAGTSLDLSVALTYEPLGLSVRSVALDGGICTAGEARVDCVLAELAAADTALLRVTFTGVAVGSWPLDVAVNAPGDTNPQDNAAQTLVSVRPAADLSVRFDQEDLFAAPGGARRVPFTLVNAGPMVAPAVVLDFTSEQAALLAVESLDGCAPESVGAWHCQLDELAVGAQLSGTLIAQATAPVPEGGARREALEASIRSAYTDPAPVDNDDTSELVVAQAVADLATRIVAAAGEIEIGEREVIELEILNNGPDQATAVLLDVALSLASVSVLEATVAGGSVCDIEGAAVSCRLEALDVGEASTVRLLVQALAGDRLRLRTSVSGANYDPADSNDQSTSELTVSEKLASGVAAGPPAGGSRGGGGGALSPLVLLVLTLLAPLSRRRSGMQA